MKCPKCQFDNPDNQKFCRECASPLQISKDIGVTKTIETPVEEYPRGSTFADRYKIIEKLGQGGMGAVYRVEDTNIGQDIAVKFIKSDIASDKKTIERFRNELKTTRMISHRNVCRMFDLAETEGIFYITMEYVSGEDLKSFIRRSGKLDIPKAISIAKEVCEGLAEAHRLGTVHRDLKSNNIMIDKDGNARIMDFGIARSLRTKGLTGEGIIIGTPEYMSPEQAEAKEIDHRSDLYSFGIILFEMVTGGVPFEGESALDTAIKHKTELPPNPREFNPQIPEGLCQLILTCLKKEKNERHQTAEEVLSELKNIEEGIPATEKFKPRKKLITSKEITVSFTLKKILWPATVIVLIAIVALIVWQLWSKQEIAPITSDKPSLVIPYFVNNTEDSTLDQLRKGISNLLISDLMQSKYFYVLSTDTTFEILKRLGLLDAANYSTEDLKKIALQGNASHILHGSFIKSGDKLRFDLFVKEVKSGRTLGSDNVLGDEESIFDMVDELTHRIKEHFELTQEQITDDIDQSVSHITTASPLAFRYYDEALEYGLKADYLRSIEMLNMALEIDAQFALAYKKLADIYGILGREELFNQYIAKAYEFREQTSQRENYHIQAAYFSSIGKDKEALDSVHQLLEIYPNDYEGNYYLGGWHNSNEEWDKAIEKLEINRRNRVKHVYSYSRLSMAYRAKGLYTEAKEVLDDYLDTFSDNNYIYRSIANVFSIQGAYDEASAMINKAYILDPLNPINFENFGDVYHAKGDFAKAEEAYHKLLNAKDPAFHYVGYNNLPFVYLLQGKIQKAKEWLIQGIEFARKHGASSREANFHSHLAYIMRQSADYEGALEECIQAHPPSRILGHKVLIYAAMGLHDKAQETMDDWKELIGPLDQSRLSREYDHLMGHIELSKGNFSKAIEFLKEAASSLPHQRHKKGDYHAICINSLAFAFFKSGDIKNAEAEYTKITELTTGRHFFGDIYAKSFYMLGKIYEQQSYIAKAVENYEKFLDLWKDADPGIAEVENAKKRLAGLKTSNS
ncbi:MAG: protein kinase [Candidatus Aminicenantes bacterium]|nr:MAG: protein kinase [Candidatus Aminicenantes bacterium]